MTQEISKDMFNTMVDAALRYGGVPRDYLFEYPYNEATSKKILRNAENVVQQIIGNLDVVVVK